MLPIFVFIMLFVETGFATFYCMGISLGCGYRCNGGNPVACSTANNGPNKYCPGDGGLYSCSNWECGIGTYRSTSCNDCSNNICSTCPAGFYCPGDNTAYSCSTCPNQVIKTPCTLTANTVCDNCPTNMFLPVDKNSYNDCTCNSDYFGSYATGCRKCTNCSQINGYSSSSCTSTTDAICGICPLNSIFLPNATNYWECVCKPGYYGSVTGPTTSTCQPCPHGQFCPRNNTIKCDC